MTKSSPSSFPSFSSIPSHYLTKYVATSIDIACCFHEVARGLEEDEPPGTQGTVGSAQYCRKAGTVCTHTHYGCSVCRYEYGVRFSDLRVTLVQPYWS